MMTKKKILIGSIFAALLMVSMPFISALQTAPVKTSISVQPSNPTDTINIQSINLPAVTNDVNLILSIDLKTATPEQIKNGIKLAADVLDYLHYPAKATEIRQKLQGIIGTLIKCALAYLELEALMLVGATLDHIAIWYYNHDNQAMYDYYEGLLMNVFDHFTDVGDWLIANCLPSAGCNACGDATGTGSIAPMASN